MAREIDNFFPDRFKYHNVRVWDEESTHLLPYWKETHRFIEDARLGSSQLLLPQPTQNWLSPAPSGDWCPPAHLALGSVPFIALSILMSSPLGPMPLSACPLPVYRLLGLRENELTTSHLHRAQGTRVLVHCKMGVSRSAATVLAYAMKQYGWGLEQALIHVQELRPIVRPNPGFLRQLQTYQGILTARYRGRGQGRS